MTHIKTYLWKEWGQNRLLAFSALGVVLVISVVALLVDATEAGQGVVMLGGPILAVILGVYAMGREQGMIQGFWQSRPLRVTAWVLSKYAIGLVILGGVLAVLAAIQLILLYAADLPNRALGGFRVLALVYSWFVLAMYSVAFVLGQWIRGVMHALILSVGAVALILLVPVIVPWLDAWSLTFMTRVGPSILKTPGYAMFAVGMVTFSAIMVTLCHRLVKKRIQIDVDQRAIAWSTVILLLVLGAGALFPIGTNLTPEQILDLPVKQNARVVAMAAQDNQVLVLLHDGPQRNSSRTRRFGLVRVEINAGEAPGGDQAVSMGEPLWFLESEGQSSYTLVQDLAWSEADPSLAYVLARKSQLTDKNETDVSYSLMTLRLDNVLNPIADDLDLTPLLSEGYSILSVSLEQTRLYVYEHRKQSRLLAFSLDKPERPVLTSSEIVSPLGFSGPRPPRNKLTQYQITTLSGSQDPPRITYDLTRKNSWPWTEIREDRILAFTGDWVLTLFGKDEIGTDGVVLTSISQRPRSPIQRLLHLGYGCVLDSLDDWVLCAHDLGVTVYRISDGHEIQRVGHYAAGQGFGDMVILPDKRVILGSDKLHVLRLPEK
ncbi:MAG: hypothetical protein HQ515_15655 [Phycisphaeraceae bacterium]|nr:hypothetical protein [Phycisphaeraceae bacterium]